MKANNKKKQYFKFITCLLLGFTIGYFMKSQAVNSDSFDISYISQDELIELEHKRINNQDIADQQLFFGKLDEAIKLLKQIANEKIGHGNRVVFSQGIVSGDGVKSISNQVHEELVSRYLSKMSGLSKGQNNENIKQTNTDYDLYHLYEFGF